MPDDIPRMFEALALRASYDARWTDGVKNSETWEARSAIQSGALHPRLLLRQCIPPEQARDIARDGLVLHPSDPYLLNNMAFSLIGNDQLAEAATMLLRGRSLRAGNRERLTQVATEAMWLFRIGEVDEGRRRYNSAIRLFERLHQTDEAARAALMLTQEEFFAGSSSAEEAWKRSLRLVEKSKKSPSVRDLQERVEKVRRSGTPALVPNQRTGTAIVLFSDKQAILQPGEFENV